MKTEGLAVASPSLFGRITVTQKCVYCDREATDEDALGLPACAEHIHEADEYCEERTGRDPNEDPMLWCGEHLDNWQPGCERCEACSMHHYGKGVAEAKESGEIFLEVYELNAPEDMQMPYGNLWP